MSAADDKQTILVQSKNGVMYVEINRPEKKNAITQAMYAALADAFEQAESDTAVRVVLLSGCEACFTSGNDLGDFLNNPPADDSHPVFRFLMAMATAQKPIVAAVNGPAVGVGTTLLLHCDLVYADRSAQFQLPFVNLALCPEAASSLLLPQQVGYARAAELLLLGEPFDADKALAYGLINAICTADELMARAQSSALRIAAQPPTAVRLTKRLLKQSNQAAVRERIVEEGKHFLEQLQSPEAKEALQAFFEHRKPDFSRFG